MFYKVIKKIEPSTTEWMKDINKNKIIEETKKFNSSNINIIESTKTIIRILYLLNQGDSLSSTDKSNIFFNVTKLFSSSNASLRRLVYLTISALNTNDTEGAFMLTSSLIKDVTNSLSPDMFKANALRVLSKITKPSLFTQIDRYIKQNLFSKNSFIVNSALIAALRLYNLNSSIIKNWINEINNCLNSPKEMTSFHALLLMRKLKSNDKVAVNKMLISMCQNKKFVNSPIAEITLINYIVLTIKNSTSNSKELLDYLQMSLHNRNESVSFEAARSICYLNKYFPTNILKLAISTLQSFINSSIPIQRFAAVRTLNKYSNELSHVMLYCKKDLEDLIEDPNKNIATLAISTLLKTFEINTMNKLLKSLKNFIDKISSELKSEIISAIKTCCLKYPDEHPNLFHIFTYILKGERDYFSKKAIIDAILDIISKINSSIDIALDILCEYIEDCEYPKLTISILNILGEYASLTKQPSNFIRYIYNRYTLELPPVRCAAITTLGKIGAKLPDLLENIKVILNRCTYDDNDEVRDRATFYLSVLERNCLNVVLDNDLLKFSLDDIEYSVKLYLKGNFEKPFTNSDIKKSKNTKTTKKEKKDNITTSKNISNKPLNSFEQLTKLLSEITRFSSYGEILSISSPIFITEKESEYVVSYRKIIYHKYIAIQYSIKNTIKDQILTNSFIELSTNNQWKIKEIISENHIKPQKIGHIYISFQRPLNCYLSDPMSNILNFTIKDPDSKNLEYDEGIKDEYKLEDININLSDFMCPNNISLNDFKNKWTSHTKKKEKILILKLKRTDCNGIIQDLIDLLGMSLVNDGKNNFPTQSTKFVVNLTGIFLPLSDKKSSMQKKKVEIYARAMVMLIGEVEGVSLQIALRSSFYDICEMIGGIISMYDI